MSDFILITGTDDFTIKEESSRIAREEFGPDLQSSDIEIIEGDIDESSADSVLGRLIQTLQTPPFLAEEKKVWLKHFPNFSKVLSGRASDRKGTNIEILIKYIKKGIPNDTKLIIDGPNIPKNSALYKTAKKNYKVKLYDKLELANKNFKQAQRARIFQLVEKTGKIIKPEALEFLLDTMPSDSGCLKNEIEKLICYIDSKNEIEIEDCRAVCSHTPEVVGWEFSEAVGMRDRIRALKALDTVASMPENARSSSMYELGLLGAAINKIQSLLKIKIDEKKLRIPPNANAGYFYSLYKHADDDKKNTYIMKRYRNPYAAFKSWEASANFAENEFPKLIKELLQTQKLLVSGGTADRRTALELLIFKLTDKRKNL